MAQPVKQGTLNDLYPVRMRYKPELDSGINVSALSAKARHELLKRMVLIDQKYRIPLNTNKTIGTNEENRLSALMILNDEVNQTILLKMVRQYGWPCDVSKDSLATRAYLIVWHGRDSYRKMIPFYPYLVKAQKTGCIPGVALNAMRNKLAELKKAE